MKRIVLYISLIIGFWQAVLLQGQQTPIYSQYTFNSFLINPAFAGAEGYTSVNLTAREQWVKFPSSPKTHAISMQSRITRGYIPQKNTAKRRYAKRRPTGRVGLGGYIYNDKNGLIDRTGLQFTYAYHINFLNKTQFSMGLAGSAYQYKIDRNLITLAQESDKLLNNTDLNMFIPDATFGMAVMRMGGYVGLSVSDLFRSSISFGEKGSINYRTQRHYNLSAYYLFELDEYYAIEPSFWVKMSEAMAGQIDLGARMYYKEDYWGGLSYRTGANGGSLIAFGGVKYKFMFFGYAFDYTFSDIMRSTLGSHEFMLGFRFGDNARRYRWVSRY